jgi:hypothetical protein
LSSAASLNDAGMTARGWSDDGPIGKRAVPIASRSDAGLTTAKGTPPITAVSSEPAVVIYCSRLCSCYCCQELDDQSVRLVPVDHCCCCCCRHPLGFTRARRRSILAVGHRHAWTSRSRSRWHRLTSADWSRQHLATSPSDAGRMLRAAVDRQADPPTNGHFVQLSRPVSRLVCLPSPPVSPRHLDKLCGDRQVPPRPRLLGVDPGVSSENRPTASASRRVTGPETASGWQRLPRAENQCVARSCVAASQENLLGGLLARDVGMEIIRTCTLLGPVGDETKKKNEADIPSMNASKKTADGNRRHLHSSARVDGRRFALLTDRLGGGSDQL